MKIGKSRIHLFILLFAVSSLLVHFPSEAFAEENTVIAIISVGDQPRGIAFDSENNRMYVANRSDDTVSVINTATNGVDAIISVGAQPRGIAFDSENNRMYVANRSDDTVSVINTATNGVDAIISVGDQPRGIAFDSENNRMYVTNRSDDTVSVINTATNNVDAIISVGDQPHGIAFDSENNRMYVGNQSDDTVSVINTATNGVIETISVGNTPRGIAFDSENNRMYVLNFNDDTVSVINTATNNVDAIISVGVQPQYAAFDSAYNRMYVGNQSDDTVSVINTATNGVIAIISVGSTPHGIAFDSENNRMYVANRSDDTVSVIDIVPVAEEGVNDCYDCEAPKLTKVEVHITSSTSDEIIDDNSPQISETRDYVWNFDQKSPYPMFGDDITPIVADPGDEVEIILELTDNRTLKRIADSATYTNFLTKPDDMNRFYANNFDESGKVSTTFYEWHQTGEDLVYDYDDTVQWSDAEVTIEEVEDIDNRVCCNQDGLAETFTISFKMKFLQPMQTTDVWIQATDSYTNFFKVSLPLTLKVSGNEPLLFESKIHQKVLSFFDESMLFELVSDWTGSSQDVSELTAVLGIPDEQLPLWVTNLALWVSEDKITIVDMIMSIEHLINN